MISFKEEIIINANVCDYYHLIDCYALWYELRSWKNRIILVIEYTILIFLCVCEI